MRVMAICDHCNGEICSTNDLMANDRGVYHAGGGRWDASSCYAKAKEERRRVDLLKEQEQWGDEELGMGNK